MGDPLTIIDSAGQACYSVRTVPDVAERLSLRTAGGGELAAIARDAKSGGFQIIVAGERVALVRSRGLIRKQYLIDTPDCDISVYGDVYRGMYALSIGADLERAPQVQVRRETASGRAAGNFGLLVIVPDDDDPARLLAMVLGIEYLAEDRRVGSDELRTGRRAMTGLGARIPGI
jgi:hypothetical protein